MKAATVFFCYAWGSEERYEKLEFLRSEIVKNAQFQIDVILDRHTYEDNEDFDKLRERIREYDLIVVFCTPDFKKIINDPDSNKNKDREVVKEFRIIEERYKIEPSSVFPVIFEGNKEKSLFDVFKERNARVFKDFAIVKDRHGRYFVSASKDKKKEFRLFIGKIFNTAIYNTKNKSEEYESTREAMDKLFSLTDTIRIPDSCLVKPDIYSLILDQKCFFVVGRKGSGKSTFINNFRDMDKELFDKRYKQMIPLSAEAFQHEEAYATLITKHIKDITIISSYDMLCIFWQVYFILHSIVTIRAEIECFNITEKDPRYKVFDQYTKKLKAKIGLRINQRRYRPILSDSVPKSIFLAAVELIDNQFQAALDSCNDDELLVTSFSAKFNTQEIIENCFGKKDTRKFLDALQLCKKKILISLDGFDTHSEDFRIMTETLFTHTEEYNNRNEYEKLFFRTLIEVVTNFKYNKYKDEAVNVFGRYIDFCIVLPKDRYDQVVEYDRDSFKRQFGSMSWTAFELLKLLTKRMEYLVSTITHKQISDSSKDYFQRMDYALSFFPGLPKTIPMKVQGNVISMSLFNYILRSSFWRPRDVISNLSSLLSRIVHIDTDGEFVSDPSIKLSAEEVKLAIKDNARRIIQEEFIDEYKHVFKNLSDVLGEFQWCNEQMKVSEFRDLVNGLRFDASYSYDMTITENKISILYQLGVIGLRYDKSIMSNMHYLHNICFVFNAGMSPFEEFLKHRFRKETDVQIVFNPIFARELGLIFDNTTELLGNWSTEYINANYKMKELIHPL